MAAGHGFLPIGRGIVPAVGRERPVAAASAVPAHEPKPRGIFAEGLLEVEQIAVLAEGDHLPALDEVVHALEGLRLGGVLAHIEVAANYVYVIIPRLSKIIEALMELEIPVQKEYFMDFICAHDNEDIEESGKTELETYGIVQGEEDAYIEVVIKEAVKKGLVEYDSDNQTYTFTASGKKFQKKPKSFIVNYDDDEDVEDATIDDSITELMEEIVKDAPIKKNTGQLNKKSSMKIKLIHAIDNQKALDDFAESQGLDFDVILDELESIVQCGTHINIDYFLEEVFTEDNIEEVVGFFEDNDGNLQKALKEFKDAYSPEEIRLLRIKYLTKRQ